MNIKIYKLLMVIVFAFLLNSLKAQEVVTTAGGNNSGDGGSVSYTIGQFAYISISGSSASVYQGVQQPFEIWVYSSLDEQKDPQLQSTVYPNPVKDNLILQVKDYNMETMYYQLFGTNGKLITEKSITKNETTISMKNLSAGTFFLKVFFKNKEVKTFKIIKH